MIRLAFCHASFIFKDVFLFFSAIACQRRTFQFHSVPFEARVADLVHTFKQSIVIDRGFRGTWIALLELFIPNRSLLRTYFAS